MTEMKQFEVLKKGTTVYTLKDNKVVSGIVYIIEIKISEDKHQITNYINIGIDGKFDCCIAKDEDCYLSKEELIKSL